MREIKRLPADEEMRWEEEVEMKKEMVKNSGLAFHNCDDILVSYCRDYGKRIEEIKFLSRHGLMSKDEQELKLRLLRFIPEDRLPKNGWETFRKAEKAFRKAKEARDRAEKAYKETEKKCKEAYQAGGGGVNTFLETVKIYNFDEVSDARYAASVAVEDAWDALVEATQAYVAENQETFEQLHNELCPDCPRG